jgi:hypothetical protein
MGMTAMKRLRLKAEWKWRARRLRREQEARHALREWLLM